MCINFVKVALIPLVFLMLFLAISLPIATSQQENHGKVVVIDPGHGGLDCGVISQSGTKESDIVLVLAKALGSYLESSGFEVVYTRKNQSALVGGNFVKKTDMQKRVQIISRVNPSLVISLHLNSFSDRTRRGIQVFFGDDDDREVAEYVQSQLNKQFNLPDVHREFSILQTDKYILNESPCPSIIIECGFLSNEIDEGNLTNDLYRHRLAQGIYESVLLWFYGEEFH